jgi:hypothetical protein
MGWVVKATSRSLLPWERDPVPAVQVAWWGLGSNWTSTNNLSTAQFRARSESLYVLRYPGGDNQAVFRGY